MLPLTDKDFNRLYTYIKKNYGIDLSKKKQLIVSRLSNTLASQGYRDFSAYVDEILSGRDKEMVTAMLNKLTTNYTFFMREKEHLDYFCNNIIPEIVRRHERDKTLAIWSAGCSSGEEPYNITMFLYDYLGSRAKDWDTRILATDISAQALASARRGTYNLPDTIPADWKRKYFTPGRDGTHTVTPAVKDNVIFQTFNLMDPIKFRRKFDVIFCRNVMIYFDQPTKDALVRRFTTPPSLAVIC